MLRLPSDHLEVFEDFQVMLLGPKMVSEAIPEHQIFKNFILGEHAPRAPPSLILSIWLQLSVQKPNQCNFASARPDIVKVI